MPSYHRPALSHDVLAEVCRATAAIVVLCLLLAIFRPALFALFFGFSCHFLCPSPAFVFFCLMCARWYVYHTSVSYLPASLSMCWCWLTIPDMGHSSFACAERQIFGNPTKTSGQTGTCGRVRSGQGCDGRQEGESRHGQQEAKERAPVCFRPARPRRDRYPLPGLVSACSAHPPINPPPTSSTAQDVSRRTSCGV